MLDGWWCGVRQTWCEGEREYVGQVESAAVMAGRDTGCCFYSPGGHLALTAPSAQHVCIVYHQTEIW